MKVRINKEKTTNLREKQKKINDLIPSKDVAHFLKNIKYEFDIFEMMVIVGRSNLSQAEKFEALKWIMQNFPDEPIPYSLFEHFYSRLKNREDMCPCCRVRWLYHNKFYEEAIGDKIADIEVEENKKIELNVTPLYDKAKWWNLLKEWKLTPNMTEKQKAAFDEKLDKAFENPIISHVGTITKEDFEKMTYGSHSLFGMINFYMNNHEHFCDDMMNSFDFDLPLPFKPGDCVRLCGEDDDGSVYVVVTDDEDEENNSIVVYADGSIKSPAKVDLYNCEYAPYGAYSEVDEYLGNLVKTSRDDFISIENVVEALNKQRDYIIELVRHKNIIVE